MENFSQYIDMLIDSCKSSITQMTNLNVQDVQNSQFLDKKKNSHLLISLHTRITINK